MRATIQGRVLAEASDDEIVMIEGNVYFPPGTVAHELLSESETPYVCPWKGRSQYFNAVIDGKVVEDVGWSYPTPLTSAVERVGRDFSDFVAFSPFVTVDSHG